MPTTPTERWLVAGVDDSPHGVTVAHVAQVLGRRLDLKVLLVHAIGGPAARTTLVGDRRLDCIDAGRVVLDAITARVDPAGEMKTRLVFGGAGEQLATQLAEFDAELVVTGSRGFGSLRAGLSRSVSRRLTVAVDTPVAIVPPGVDPRWELGSDVICGVDESSSDAAVRFAGELADRAGARLTLLHAREFTVGRLPEVVTTSGELFRGTTEADVASARQLVQSHLPLVRRAGDVDLELPVGEPAHCLLNAAGEEPGSLLVVGSRRHGIFRSLFGGSVSADLAAHAEVPVIVVGAEPPASEPGVNRRSS